MRPVLVGPNTVGKTTVIETLTICSTYCRPFTHRRSSLTSSSSSGFFDLPSNLPLVRCEPAERFDDFERTV